MMTESEIIKAKSMLKKLEEAYEAYYDTSKGMPYDIDETLRETAICLENALDEITRQNAEIESLQKRLADYPPLKDEQEQKGENMSVHDCGVKYAKMAVKDFAERLIEKEVCFETDDGQEEYFVSVKDIHRLKKEMVGDV